MTLLLLSYMLGYDKKVRAGMRTILALLVVGGAVGVFFMNYSNTAFAQQSAQEHEAPSHVSCELNGLAKEEIYAHQDVVWYLEKLESLEDLHTDSGFYRGNNLTLSLLLAERLEEYSHTNQLIILSNFIDRMELMSSDILQTTRKIYDEEFLRVYKEILGTSCQKIQKGTMVSNEPVEGVLLDTEHIAITYQVRTYRFEKDKKVVTFYVESKGPLKGINRHFGDGATYRCEREQCEQLYHIYEQDKDYTIKLFGGTTMYNGWYEEVRFNPRNADINGAGYSHDDKDDKETEEVIQEIVEELDLTNESVEDTTASEDILADDEGTTEEDLEFIKSFLGIEF